MLFTASFCQQATTMSSYKPTPRAVASPDAPQKPLVRKRARSGGAEWVQVSSTEPDVDVEKNVKYTRRRKYTIKRGHRTIYFLPYCGVHGQICKTQVLHYFNISHPVVQSVAEAKAAAAITPP